MRQVTISTQTQIRPLVVTPPTTPKHITILPSLIFRLIQPAHTPRLTPITTTTAGDNSQTTEPNFPRSTCRDDHLRSTHPNHPKPQTPDPVEKDSSTHHLPQTPATAAVRHARDSGYTAARGTPSIHSTSPSTPSLMLLYPPRHCSSPIRLSLVLSCPLDSPAPKRPPG